MIADDVERLRAFILDTRERGEERLPSEPHLSSALGVSRGRLRTLLKKVEGEGLIWRHVGKGTFVGQQDPIRDHGRVAKQISVDQLIQARLITEPPLAAQAAMHATADDLAQLEACLQGMIDATDYDGFKRFDDRLHHQVALATHNPLLILLYETLKTEIAPRLHTRMSMIFGPTPSEPRQQTHREHELLVEAIKLNDPRGAEHLMRTHIQSVRARLFGDI